MTQLFKHLWTEGKADVALTHIVSSANGNVLAALAQNNIYTSIDFGLNWLILYYGSKNILTSIVLSADGTKLAAVSTNNIYFFIISNKQPRILQIDKISKIRLSSDGKLLFAITSEGFFHSIKTDETILKRNILTRAFTREIEVMNFVSSETGKYLALILENNVLLISNNYGGTWNTILDETINLNNIVSSNDFSVLVASDNNYIYISSDFGKNWSRIESIPIAHKWLAIAISTDGTNIIAISYNGTFISTDSGASWVIELVEIISGHFPEAIIFTDRSGSTTFKIWTDNMGGSMTTTSDQRELVAVLITPFDIKMAPSTLTATEIDIALIDNFIIKNELNYLHGAAESGLGAAKSFEKKYLKYKNKYFQLMKNNGNMI
jgi:photosystem II stability/assembly factor-like uncharacterized protein